jgi:hypothetical protein
MQIVSGLTGSSDPLKVSISPSRTIRITRRATRSGSAITEPGVDRFASDPSAS